MSTYRVDWECCGNTTETDSYEPESCPFCDSYSSKDVILILDELYQITPDNLADDIARDVAESAKYNIRKIRDRISESKQC